MRPRALFSTGTKTRKQSLPECPVCQALDMKSCVRNRGVYAAQVLPQLGVTMTDTKKVERHVREPIKELTGFDHLHDLIDNAMAATGEKAYYVRNQLMLART